MQGRHSLGVDLTFANDNINQIRRLREHLRRLAEEHSIIPTVIQEGNNQANQPMATGGEKQLVMKDYARPIIGTILSCIQLCCYTQNLTKWQLTGHVGCWVLQYMCIPHPHELNDEMLNRHNREGLAMHEHPVRVHLENRRHTGRLPMSAHPVNPLCREHAHNELASSSH